MNGTQYHVKFMSKVIPTNISKSEREKLKKILFTKISKFRSLKESGDFLNDLLTESELVMIIRRLQIAKMLLGEFPYYQIRNSLGVGYDTIKTVRHKLDTGSGGYLRFIKQLKI